MEGGTLGERIQAKINRILEAHTPPPHAQGVEEAMTEIMEKGYMVLQHELQQNN